MASRQCLRRLRNSKEGGRDGGGGRGEWEWGVWCQEGSWAVLESRCRRTGHHCSLLSRTGQLNERGYLSVDGMLAFVQSRQMSSESCVPDFGLLFIGYSSGPLALDLIAHIVAVGRNNCICKNFLGNLKNAILLEFLNARSLKLALYLKVLSYI